MPVKNLTCIICPLGCSLKVEMDGEFSKEVTGNGCNRGVDYARKECTNPTRVITTSVAVKNGVLPVVPVKSAGEIPKLLMTECMGVIKKSEICAPVTIGQKIIENILDTGVDIVATRDVKLL